MSFHLIYTNTIIKPDNILQRKNLRFKILAFSSCVILLVDGILTADPVLLTTMLEHIPGSPLDVT